MIHPEQRILSIMSRFLFNFLLDAQTTVFSEHHDSWTTHVSIRVLLPDPENSSPFVHFGTPSCTINHVSPSIKISRIASCGIAGTDVRQAIDERIGEVFPLSEIRKNGIVLLKIPKMIPRIRRVRERRRLYIPREYCCNPGLPQVIMALHLVPVLKYHKARDRRRRIDGGKSGQVLPGNCMSGMYLEYSESFCGITP